jgi:hypothetical protein
VWIKAICGALCLGKFGGLEVWCVLYIELRACLISYQNTFNVKTVICGQHIQNGYV